MLDLLLPEPGAYYVMDRGYLDFERLYHLHEAGSFFVTRGQVEPQIRTSLLASGGSHDRLDLRSNRDPEWLLLAPRLRGPAAPHPVQRSETDKTLVFLTNNFGLPH